MCRFNTLTAARRLANSNKIKVFLQGFFKSHCSMTTPPTENQFVFRKFYGFGDSVLPFVLRFLIKGLKKANEKIGNELK